jgi:hypothetical protein
MGVPQASWKDVTNILGFAAKGDFEAALAAITSVPYDPNGISLVRSFKEGALCSNCTILAAKADIVYEDGKRADIASGVYNHHALVYNVGWKENYNWIDTCPTSTAKSFFGSSIYDMMPKTFYGPMQALALAGVDEATQWFTSADGKYRSGHYVDKADKFIFQFEAINYAKKDQIVYIDLELESVSGKVGRHSVLLPITATSKCIALKDWAIAQISLSMRRLHWL